MQVCNSNAIAITSQHSNLKLDFRSWVEKKCANPILSLKSWFDTSWSEGWNSNLSNEHLINDDPEEVHPISSKLQFIIWYWSESAIDSHCFKPECRIGLQSYFKTSIDRTTELLPSSSSQRWDDFLFIPLCEAVFWYSNLAEDKSYTRYSI